MLFAPLVFAGLALVFYRPAHETPTPAARTESQASSSPKLPEAPATETTSAEAKAETQTPTPAFQVAASVRGYRASPAERADYSARLATEANLLLWSQALKDRANTGDADAAASLSALYTYCAEVLAYPFIPLKPVANRPPQPDPNAAAKLRCAGMGEPGRLTAFNLSSDAKAWRRTAAHLGHALSVLAESGSARMRGFGPISPTELQARMAAEELLREGDYAALVRSSPIFATLSGWRMQLAWEISFCELSPPCERGRRCDLCDPRGREPRLATLSPREKRMLAGQQLQILQAIQSGNFAELWRKPTAPGT
ncbi:MAG: hypothetical protein KDI60_21600, partial [Xanthomonadales bacterium]|nr:hypothetical protein [Xanthomonadales bacterium]